LHQRDVDLENVVGNLLTQEDT